MDWVAAVLAVGAMAAAGFEVWLAARQHAKRSSYAWAAWTPLAMLAFAAGFWEGAGPLAAIALAMVFGPFAYPMVRGLLWLRLDGWSRHAEDAASEAEAMKYSAMDFGGVRAPAAAEASSLNPPAASATTTPIAVVAAPDSRLDRATRERRPAWVARAEFLLAISVCVIGIALYLGSMIASLRGAPGPTDEERIAETLEINGFAGPRIEGLGAPCADGRSVAYRWSAIGSAGRACVDPSEGLVSLWVEKTWPRQPL